MTSRKRNEYLDLGLSDEEEGPAQDSDELQDIKHSRLKGVNSRGSKRRKVDIADDEGSEASEDGEVQPEDHPNTDPVPITSSSAANPSRKSTPGSKSKLNLKPLTPAQLAKSEAKVRKTGVIYISRIPPFMKPSTLRHLLTPYGTISRLFLTPEPPTTYSRRLKAGGNKKRSFIDGWVEFASKKDAKICTETLNGQSIGGRKRGWYHDDIWNLKYLRGFKWGDLMETVQSEERVREARMRAEREREGRERKAFLGNVEAAKKERGKEEKRKKKAEKEKEESTGETRVKESGRDSDGVSMVDAGKSSIEEGSKQTRKNGFERRFRQNEVKIREPVGEGLENQPEDVRRVLSKIF